MFENFFHSSAAHVKDDVIIKTCAHSINYILTRVIVFQSLLLR